MSFTRKQQNTRDILKCAVQNGKFCAVFFSHSHNDGFDLYLTLAHLQNFARFKAVKDKFALKTIFRSVVGQILGMYFKFGAIQRGIPWPSTAVADTKSIEPWDK